MILFNLNRKKWGRNIPFIDENYKSHHILSVKGTAHLAKPTPPILSDLEFPNKIECKKLVMTKSSGFTIGFWYMHPGSGTNWLGLLRQLS